MSERISGGSLSTAAMGTLDPYATVRDAQTALKLGDAPEYKPEDRLPHRALTSKWLRLSLKYWKIPPIILAMEMT